MGTYEVISTELLTKALSKLQKLLLVLVALFLACKCNYIQHASRKIMTEMCVCVCVHPHEIPSVLSPGPHVFAFVKVAFNLTNT